MDDELTADVLRCFDAVGRFNGRTYVYEQLELARTWSQRARGAGIIGANLVRNASDNSIFLAP